MVTTLRNDDIIEKKGSLKRKQFSLQHAALIFASNLFTFALLQSQVGGGVKGVQKAI